MAKKNKLSQPLETEQNPGENMEAQAKNGQETELEFESVSGNRVRYIKVAELADQEVVGTYEGSERGGLYDKLSHKIKLLNGETVMVNGCGTLDKGIEKVSEGEVIKLEYTGMNTIKDGKFKGKTAHLVDVKRLKA